MLLPVSATAFFVDKVSVTAFLYCYNCRLERYNIVETYNVFLIFFKSLFFGFCNDIIALLIFTEVKNEKIFKIFNRCSDNARYDLLHVDRHFLCIRILY